MKLLTFIARTFVGVLFIISGFIKLNDPIGFSYKLQEYFSSEVLNLPFLEPYALALAIFVVVFEVVLESKRAGKRDSNTTTQRPANQINAARRNARSD